MTLKDVLAELRQLEQQAEALLELGNSRDPYAQERAMGHYKVMKDRLADRLREFQRQRRGEGPEWWASSFESALRQAHIAMRTPTSTSSRNPKWASAVRDLCFELNYHVDQLQAGLKG
ncbi:hypothetical protein V9K97_13605 [Variovorax sp. CCNWLW186]|uniref:hypothetical protein n=1 Tax=Variovorax sp. CCNWLW186 TaxID=3127473 RepID=UPI003076D2A9